MEKPEYTHGNHILGMTEQHILIEIIQSRFGGTLLKGAHEEDGEACLIEARNAALGLPWSDTPVDFIDLRSFNDAWVDDALRTEHMVRLGVAYWDWPEWSDGRQMEIARKLALLTCQRLLPPLLEDVGIDRKLVDACRDAQTLEVARVAAAGAAGAAWAAADAAAGVVWAADAAARAAAGAAARAAAGAAARAAAGAAGAAAGDAILIQAVDLWIEVLS